MKTYTCDHFKIPAKLPLMTRCDLIPAICSQLKKQQLGQQQRKKKPHNEISTKTDWKIESSSNRIRIKRKPLK